MKITIFPSDQGDCLLVEAGDSTTILADGGIPDTYIRHVRPSLGIWARCNPGRAAHTWGLKAGQAAGMRSAYLPRPAQLGPGTPLPEPAFDVAVASVTELADLLGA